MFSIYQNWCRISSTGAGWHSIPGDQRIPDQVSYHRSMSACGAAGFWALAVHLLATMQLGGDFLVSGGSNQGFKPPEKNIPKWWDFLGFYCAKSDFWPQKSQNGIFTSQTSPNQQHPPKDIQWKRKVGFSSIWEFSRDKKWVLYLLYCFGFSEKRLTSLMLPNIFC